MFMHCVIYRVVSKNNKTKPEASLKLETFVVTMENLTQIKDNNLML